MIRVYFVFEDPLDEAEANLSFVDVPTRDPGKALERIEEAAESGELWKVMYPDDQEHPYRLVRGKMSYNITSKVVAKPGAVILSASEGSR